MNFHIKIYCLKMFKKLQKNLYAWSEFITYFKLSHEFFTVKIKNSIQTCFYIIICT